MIGPLIRAAKRGMSCVFLALPFVGAVSLYAIPYRPNLFDVEWLLEAGLVWVGILLVVANAPIRLSELRLRRQRSIGLYHVTPNPNAQRIITEDNGIEFAHIKASTGLCTNLGNRCFIGECAFFFAEEPSRLHKFINLFGRHRDDGNTVLHLKGDDIPERLYRRLSDGAILAPGDVHARVRRLGTPCP